jgi:hypothetical protein
MRSTERFMVASRILHLSIHWSFNMFGLELRLNRAVNVATREKVVIPALKVD